MYITIKDFRISICQNIIICDRISENGSKSHMKSIVFQHAFNCIYTYTNIFSEHL